MKTFSLNLKNKLYSFSSPQVMAIINVTPDSFAFSYGSASREELLTSVAQAIADGATILDIGAYSTRPNAKEVSEQEEWERLQPALEGIRSRYPEAIISLDTFRANIARKAVTEYDVDIINDVSGGELDKDMFATVAELGTPYILTHMRGTPTTMSELTDYKDLMGDIIDYFQRKVDQLHRLGVKDIIIDPGFGFAKTIEQNYQLLAEMQQLDILNLPILAGLSRKSMLFRTLDVTPQSSSALTATTVVNTIALERGAAFLRVHDVREARDTITIFRWAQKLGRDDF